MIVDAIQFTKMIPVFGTSKFESRYEAAQGWVIEVRGSDVVLERKANPSQNILAVPAFRVVGEGFCIPETHTSEPFVRPAGLLSEAGIAAALRSEAARDSVQSGVGLTPDQAATQAYAGEQMAQQGRKGKRK